MFSTDLSDEKLGQIFLNLNLIGIINNNEHILIFKL